MLQIELDGVSMRAQQRHFRIDNRVFPTSLSVGVMHYQHTQVLVEGIFQDQREM